MEANDNKEEGNEEGDEEVKKLPELIPFTVEKFPFNNFNPELKEIINQIIDAEETDIKSRIEGLSPELNALYVKGVEFQEKVQELIDNPNWKAKEIEGDFKGYFMKGDDALIQAKSVNIIDATPLELYAYLLMYKYKTEYDPTYISGEDVEVYPGNFTISHLKYKGKLYVSNRDLLIIKYTAYQENGGIYIGAGSIEDPRVPPGKDPVRADLHVIFCSTIGSRSTD